MSENIYGNATQMRVYLRLKTLIKSK